MLCGTVVPTGPVRGISQYPEGLRATGRPTTADLVVVELVALAEEGAVPGSPVMAIMPE